MTGAAPSCLLRRRCWARYGNARGRDYHKVLRARLQSWPTGWRRRWGRWGTGCSPIRPGAGGAELATRSGQGWRAASTLVLSREGGSMFFLGEITWIWPCRPPMRWPATAAAARLACKPAPRRPFVAPRWMRGAVISYLTIEHDGPIPEAFRAAIGNRIYGCDDCQLVCPWNKFARRSALPDFDERACLNGQRLALLLGWSEAGVSAPHRGQPHPPHWP